MKKKILSALSIVCIGLTLSTHVLADRDAQSRHDFKRLMLSDVRLFKKLSLSDEQRDQLKEIVKQTKQDNSVFAGEKDEIRQQMQDLMKLSSWDEVTARAIIQSQIQQSSQIELNRAKAKHAMYQVLNAEQQLELANLRDNVREKRANKQDKLDAKKNRKNKRITKALDLTPEQVTQWNDLRAQAKEKLSVNKDAAQAHKQAIRSIIQATSFDESAWLALQASFEEQRIEKRLIMAKLMFDNLAMLDDQQKNKLNKIVKKMKGKSQRSGII